MTIAVGLLAQGGAVIAADREESDGVQKSDQSKIGGAWVGGRGCLAITGAGNGPYLDSLSDTLVDWFRDTNSDFKADAFAEDLRRKHYEFYKRCVLPFAPYEESVDYELLACFDPAPTRREIALAAEFGGIPGKRPALWTSHKLTLLKAEPFAAVGCGAVTAKALLTKFWVLSMPLEVAINLAAYVTYQVKRTVKDAGLDTDILVMRKNSIFHHVSFDEIAEMETKFREYEDVEQESPLLLLRGKLPPQGSPKSGQIGSAQNRQK